MKFAIIVIIIWLVFTICLKKRVSERFEFSKALLPLVLVSYLVTIDLGINYIAGAIPGLNDGIGLHSRFAFLIIGENGWSIELFRKIYDTSFTISILLTLIYFGLMFVRSRR